MENQVAAAFTAAGADIEQVIGRADDRFLMLDHEQRVAFVAQVVHHPDEPADVAWMEADARLVHHEKRVHERSAKAGGEIHPLDFAAAERAGRPIERQITEPDFAEIAQPGDDFRAQHFCAGIVRRNREADEEVARLRDRERGEFRQGEGNLGLAGAGPVSARTGEADQSIIQCLRLETPALATRAGGVGAIAAEKHAHVHFVGLALEPFEEALYAVPAIGFVIFLAVFACPFLAVDHEILVALRQLLEGDPDVDLFPGAGTEEILLRFAHLLPAENADRALGDRKRAIGNRARVIDRDRAPETAAFRTRA